MVVIFQFWQVKLWVTVFLWLSIGSSCVPSITSSFYYSLVAINKKKRCSITKAAYKDLTQSIGEHVYGIRAPLMVSELYILPLSVSRFWENGIL